MIELPAPTTESFAVPCAAALIVRTVGGVPCLLLQTRCKPGAGRENGLLELPAGKVREYESVFDTLRREVAEETGLTLTQIGGEAACRTGASLGYGVQTFQPYCVTQNLSGGYSILLTTFLCEAAGEPQGSSESHSPRWVPLTELQGLLDARPETFYPLHLGALRQYLAEQLATPHVFVYGTLKPGHRNAAWAAAVAQPQAQPATLGGAALHHLGAYPGLVFAETGGEVQGHLYTYPPAQMDAALARLDELEGYRAPGDAANLYHRELREVTLADGSVCTAWVYVYAQPLPEHSLLAGGEWQDDLPAPASLSEGGTP
ncbi:gamma-glutamylcyclotransferase [Deinococcus sp. SL84]|uniref:gamma-glutamylcyclotransferase n=1 Tax=Deinococcus sp. SL84 TaxID=2994663 RepID=UPI0022768EEB|nr:gamma-glutamylcyclotransferase [Deinococcus sp. SL84]MCY1702830.1 gamma-glutamylcyclotransferase [Deinococcus sp. SL84]